ncbi:sigma factor-like helix-turn-helix DNA-binding protein [Nonomuraea sp. KM90]|uniref:sigma factor-like helix-turn-helix DNA-binding protein n=1 Tax=Nonomuraea sp. KM90 TaxID=3457428 RepID=UPI003FCD3F57
MPWADMSYEDVARAPGIPVGTVRFRLHRARAKTRQALGGSNPATREESFDG